MNPSASTFGLDLDGAILGALVMEERIPSDIEDKLRVHLFSSRRRQLAQAVLDAWHRLGTCDLVTVTNELDRNGAGIEPAMELARLASSVPSSAHLVTHVNLLIERAATREQESYKEEINAIRRDRSLKGFEKKQAIAETIKRDLLAKGFFLATPIGFFYFLIEMRRLYELNREKIDYVALIGDWYSLNPQEPEFAYVLHVLQIESYARGKKCDVHRLAFYDRERGILYVSRFNGQMYRLDGEVIDLVPNGIDGVFFLDGPDCEPFTYLGREQGPSGLLNKLLVEPINFSEEVLSVKEQRILFGIWIFALFFESLHPTKPLLLLLGPKGAGKTIALRKVAKLLSGSNAEVFGIERDREDGFIAAVTSNYLAAFDNVDGRIRWLNDHLARLATGQKIPRRKLYTTNELINYPARCFIALNARTPQFRRDDVVDRLLLFHVQRYEQFIPEGRLISEVLQKRDALWTELLEDLNAIVELLRKDRREFSSAFRLGDFADFTWRVADAQGQGQAVLAAFEKMVGDQSEFLLEEDPLLPGLTVWLEDSSNHGRWVNAGMLFKELKPLAEAQGIAWSYKSTLSLGKRLANVVSNLKVLFEVETKKNPRGGTAEYAFRPKAGPVDETQEIATFHLTNSPSA